MLYSSLLWPLLSILPLVLPRPPHNSWLFFLSPSSASWSWARAPEHLLPSKSRTAAQGLLVWRWWTWPLLPLRGRRGAGWSGWRSWGSWRSRQEVLELWWLFNQLRRQSSRECSLSPSGESLRWCHNRGFEPLRFRNTSYRWYSGPTLLLSDPLTRLPESPQYGSTQSLSLLSNGRCKIIWAPISPQPTSRSSRPQCNSGRPSARNLDQPQYQSRHFCCPKIGPIYWPQSKTLPRKPTYR